MNMIIVIYLVFCFKLSNSVPILLTFDKQIHTQTNAKYRVFIHIDQI